MGVWMRKQHSVRTAVIIVAVSWTFIALFVGIASGLHKNYDEPSPVSASPVFFSLIRAHFLLLVLVLGGSRLQTGANLGRVLLAMAYIVCSHSRVPPPVPVEPGVHHH